MLTTEKSPFLLRMKRTGQNVELLNEDQISKVLGQYEIDFTKEKEKKW